MAKKGSFTNRTSQQALKKYVYYDNLGDVGNSSYWKNIKTQARGAYSANLDKNKIEREDLGKILLKQAQNERKKELAAIEMMLGKNIANLSKKGNVMDYYQQTLIPAMNALTNIKSAVEEVQKVARKTTYKTNTETLEEEETSNWSLTRAGLSRSSTYTDVLEDALKDPIVLQEIVSIMIENEGVAINWQEYFRTNATLYNNVILPYYRKLLSAKDLGKDTSSYEALIPVLEGISNDMRDPFVANVYSWLGLSKMVSNLEKLVEGDKVEIEKLTHAKLKSLIDKTPNTLKAQVVLGGARGHGAEVLGQLVTLKVAESLNSKTVKSVVTGTAKAATTDVVNVYINAEVSTQQIDDAILKMGNSGGSNKIETEKKVREAAKELSDAVDKYGGVIIYENTKDYSLTKKTIYDGGKRTVSSMLPVLEAIKIKNPQLFIGAIRQLMGGAILSGGDKEIDDKGAISSILAKGIAYLLFDDYANIGMATAKGTSTHALHVFRLNLVVVPLSFILESLGRAYQESQKDTLANRVARIDYTLPKIMYDEKFYASNEETSAKDSARRWKEQSEAADKVLIGVKFLQNFKDILSGIDFGNM